jgi:beta-galactosidase
MKAQLSWLDDPETFRVNQLPAHSDHNWYRNREEVNARQSSFYQSLDGEWQFKFVPNPTQIPDNFYQPDSDHSDYGMIKVPGMIELHNDAQVQYINTLYPWEGHQYRRPAGTYDQAESAGSFSEAPDNTVGLYCRRFDLGAGLRHHRVRVQFAGVERAFYLWLNGHFVGYAEDSFTPSEFDLTPYLQDEGNFIAVAVFKHSTASYLEDQDMFRFSGIFRSVTLMAQPEVHVEDLTLRPQLANDNHTGIFNLAVKLTGDAFSEANIEVDDAQGKELLAHTYPSTEEIKVDNERIANIHPWSNNDPYLYQLWITLRDDEGQVVEAVPYQFGFRRVEIAADHVLLLNGSRLIINGVNRHEWDCHTGRCISLDDMRFDINTFKKNNINAVRTCHYADRLEWYAMCDQAGIYVMAETNLESHGSWQKMGQVEPSYNVPGSLPQWRAAVVDRARTNYETLKDHTSILFWSLGNESYAGDDLVAMQDFYKHADPDRLVHYEGVCRRPSYRDRLSDFESRMYLPPKQVAQYLSNHPEKPFIECEYMHSMGNSVGGMKDYIDLVKKYPQDCGGFIWDYIDQALVVHDPVTGKEVLRYGGDFDDRHTDGAFCGDGLLFADRKEKPAMQEVRYYYGQC